jgi:hypothetical protein
MSRISQPHDTDDHREHNAVPKGLHIHDVVQGEGDSLLESLLLCMGYEEDIDRDVPGDHVELRQKLAELLLQNPCKFGGTKSNEFTR